MKKVKLILAMFLLLGVMVLGVVGYRHQQDKPDVLTVRTKKPVTCHDLQQGCLSRSEDMEVVFSLPNGAVYLTSFPVEVRLATTQPVEVNSVIVKFDMVKMDMGVNIYNLQQVEPASNLWRGKAILPVCVSGRSDWIATVMIDSGKKRYQLVYGFDVSGASQ